MKYLPLRQVGQQSDSFCIYPWKQFEARREGGGDFCCRYEALPVADDGTPWSLARHSVDEVWNGVDLRRIRRDMVAGLPVAGCQGCHEREAAGDQSDRTHANEFWLNGWLNEERLTVEQFKARAAARDYRDPGPEYVGLRMGNLCNLKCRMCYADTSSAIAADPVHSQWTSGRADFNRERWWQDADVLSRIFEKPERLRQLYLHGGEPFLIKEAGEILQYLIDRGVAHDIVLEFATNGTARPSWSHLFGGFKKVRINFSLDGCGQLNRYLRHPSDWDTILRNIDYFRTLPNAEVAYSTVVQAYNVLSLVDLFRFCDSISLPPGSVYPLVHPEHLSVRVVPRPARRLAADRLLAYASRDCLPENRALMRGLANGFERFDSDVEDGALRALFLLFTSDLDESRAERFRDVCPELHEFFLQSGTMAQLESDVVHPALPLRLTFGASDTRKWMRSGWWQDESATNDTLVWSATTRSILRVGLPRAGNIRMTLDCIPFLFPDSPTQTVTVILNGSMIGQIPLRPKRRRYAVVLPRETLSDSLNTLEFRYAYARRPRETVADSTDTRVLAVCWYSLEFAVE